MGRIRTITVPTVTTTGANGSAAGNKTTGIPVNGRLLAVQVTYGSQPATTDVTITTPGTPAKTLLTLTNVNTSGWYYPRGQVHSDVGAALTLDGTRTMVEAFPVNDYVKVTVAQGDDAGTVAVTLLVEE